MEENEKPKTLFEKPFACVTEGCNMRFTNEDHLTVHKKKHDMILNLGNGQKTNVFVADQTPTPTRFIRNCEEVGLFQDLQINPFDETFRKAVEAGKTGTQIQYADSLHVTAAGDDTLHTPHVFHFPHHADEAGHDKLAAPASAPENGRRKQSSNSDTTPVRTAAVPESAPSTPRPQPSVIIHEPAAAGTAKQTGVRTPAIQPAAAKKHETVSVAGQSMQLLLRMPDGKLVQLVQEQQAKAAPVPAPPAENGLALAKLKLKQALKSNGRVPSSSTLTPSEPEKKPVSPPSPAPSSASRRDSSHNGSGDDDDDKRTKFRERNRAAAMRCREKRKTWVQELERRAEEMQATNQQLQAEVTSLRAEVAQLKTLLLAHKSCPVTQAMHQARLIHVVAPPSELANRLSQPSKANNQSTSAPQPSTASSTREDGRNHKPPSKRQRLEPIHHDNGLVIERNDSRAEDSAPTTPTIVVRHPADINQRGYFKHLLSACASNENNLNMEKSNSMQQRLNGEDGLGEGSSGGRREESKVIKVNPNAVRYRGAEDVNVRESPVIHIIDTDDASDDGS